MDHAHPGPTNQYSAAHPGMACQFEPSLGSDGYQWGSPGKDQIGRKIMVVLVAMLLKIECLCLEFVRI